MRRSVTATLVAPTLMLAAALGIVGCDRGLAGDGLPDLDSLTPADFPLAADVKITPTGCDPDEIEVPAGWWVAFTATADDVRIQPVDPRDATSPDTGDLLTDERVEWRFTDLGDVAVECGAAGTRSPATIHVVEPDGTATTVTRPTP